MLIVYIWWHKNIKFLFSLQLLRPFTDVPRNNKSLYLGGSFINLCNLSIPHQFLHWIFLIEPISSENLHCIGSDFVSHIGCETLCYRCYVSVFATCGAIDGVTNIRKRTKTKWKVLNLDLISHIQFDNLNVIMLI